ncbi:MAG: hypothetical protein KatS3mg102_0205 [Planctomycetota bacterium]|nr:MAG: hypothetical protein KatS3mg102_0205 [Planctomycetota bacterium]
MTPETLKRLIPEMLQAYEDPDVRRQLEEAARAGDRPAVMRIAMQVQSAVLLRYRLDPEQGLRRIAAAAREHRDDPELVRLCEQLRWRLTALWNEARAGG